VVPGVGATVLLVLYFTLPLDRPFNAATVATLVLGLIALGGIVTAQVAQIRESNLPRVRAAGALATTLPLFLVLFAATYYLLARAESHAFTEPLTRVDALYFTVTVFSTVGFGDIAPRVETARILVTVQMFGDLAMIGLIGRVVLGAMSEGLRRKSETENSKL
jgi:voltage-gated potassium channel